MPDETIQLNGLRAGIATIAEEIGSEEQTVGSICSTIRSYIRQREHIDKRLVVFMYLLLRDYSPVGEVIRIIEQIPEESVEFTNAQLRKLAEDMVNRILD